VVGGSPLRSSAQRYPANLLRKHHETVHLADADADAEADRRTFAQRANSVCTQVQHPRATAAAGGGLPPAITELNVTLMLAKYPGQPQRQIPDVTTV
jgi:hypothetical protein